jgi:hypothetical protein
VWLVDQAYQQHLVQVQYVDSVVGSLIDRLEEVGLYDDALIVVAADHGVTVRPNTQHRRVANEETIGDVAAVPLFIKRPHQESGGIDDYRAETIDVLPTIADVLAIDMPWGTDGTSLFADDRPERTESRITGSKGTIVFGVDGSEARAVAARKIEHFGTDGPFGLAPPGHADLLGRSIVEFDPQPAQGVTATIRDASAFDAVDMNGPSLPAWISGSIQRDDPGETEIIVAIAVNGEIAAVTRSTETEDEKIEYGAMIPPDTLIDGANEVELYLVRGVGETRALFRL